VNSSVGVQNPHPGYDPLRKKGKIKNKNRKQIKEKGLIESLLLSL